MSEKRTSTASRSLLSAVWPPMVIFILATAVAEVVIRVLDIKPFLLPTPSSVLVTIWQTAPELWGSLKTTATAALAGFAIAVVLGVVLAVLFSTSRLILRAFFPYTVFFQTVPVVAIAPLLIIWVGPGLQAVTICALIVCIFPVIANTLTGLRSTDVALLEMFQLYGASWWRCLVKLRLPSALPNIVTGLRIASGLAVIGTIVGEFVAAVLQGDAGLGVMVQEASRIGRTDIVFAAVLTASALGLAMLGLVDLTGHLLLRRWHESERNA